ncbi:MAG: PorP/SprF family type IX secretion system membrane protein [Bacteroidota bacterium]
MKKFLFRKPEKWKEGSCLIKFKYILSLIILILTSQVFSQSDLLFDNYNINTIAHNPAAIENNGTVNAYLGIHQQWIGFDDAPNMQWGYVSNFHDKLNMGISLGVINQSVGATITQNIKVGYAYHIYFKGGHTVSLGLGAGIYFRRFDFSKLKFDEDESEIPLSAQTELKPDFDFGIEYMYKDITLGFASNHITIFNKNATIFKLPIQNHFYAEYSVDIKSGILFIPRLDFFNSGTITSLGVSGDFFLYDSFNVGLSYRYNTSFIIRAGIKINSMFQLQYSYNIGSGSFATYNSGVHEVILGLRIKKRNLSYNSPRFID